MCFYPEPKDHIEPDRSLACKPAQGPSFATTCNQIRLRLIRLQGEQKVTWAGRTSLFFVNPPAAKKFFSRTQPNPENPGGAGNSPRPPRRRARLIARPANRPRDLLRAEKRTIAGASCMAKRTILTFPPRPLL